MVIGNLLGVMIMGFVFFSIFVGLHSYSQSLKARKEQRGQGEIRLKDVFSRKQLKRISKLYPEKKIDCLLAVKNLAMVGNVKESLDLMNFYIDLSDTTIYVSKEGEHSHRISKYENLAKTSFLEVIGLSYSEIPNNNEVHGRSHEETSIDKLDTKNLEELVGVSNLRALLEKDLDKEDRLKVESVLAQLEEKQENERKKNEQEQLKREVETELKALEMFHKIDFNSKK